MAKFFDFKSRRSCLHGRTGMVLNWLSLAAVVLSIFCISLWNLWEQDVFWQIRAGDEILRGQGLQKIDEWSLTGRGRPWINIQWLGCVLLRIVHLVGDVPGLIVFRGLVAAVLFGLIALLIRGPSPGSRLLRLSLIPLIFYMLAFKMEVRPDLLVMVLFAVLVHLWTTDFRRNVRLCVSGVLIPLAANIHAGTVPFLILALIGFLWDSPMFPRKSKFILIAASGSLLFMNPYGWQIIPVLREHLAYARVAKLANYDHYPLSLSAQSFAYFGLAGWLWPIFALGAWYCALDVCCKPRETDRRFPWGTIVVGAIFTLLAIGRMRAIPYHALFFLPFVGRKISDLARDWAGLRTPRLTLTSFLIVCGVGLGFIHFRNFPLAYGLTLSRHVFPVGTTKYLNDHRPQGHLFHGAGVGGYLVWNAREYQTFVDTRETMFRHMEQRLLDATASEKVTHALCAEWQVNTALMPGVAPHFLPGVGFDDVLGRYFPESEWAITSYDPISIVFSTLR